MTNKLSSILGGRIGAKPVDNSGSTEPKPTSTNAEEIWSVEYCRQHPEEAATAIKALQWLKEIHDEQDHSVANSIKRIANDLLELQKIVRS